MMKTQIVTIVLGKKINYKKQKVICLTQYIL